MSRNFILTVTALDQGLPVARPVVECFGPEVLFDDASDGKLGALVRSLLVHSLFDPPGRPDRCGCQR